MLGQLLALMVLLPTPPTPACALDMHGIRDVYAPPDVTLTSETKRGFRTRQMWTLRRLVMLNPKRYDGNVRLKLAFHYLDEGEAQRILGKSSTVWGRRARHVLRQLYKMWPQHEHVDTVLVALGHAALLRCNPVVARHWFAQYATRYPSGSEFSRVSATLKALDSEAGKAVTARIEAARNRRPPPPKVYRAPTPSVHVPKGDHWARTPMTPCHLDGIQDFWSKERPPPERFDKLTHIRKRQVRQMRKILYQDVQRKSDLRYRIGTVLLDHAADLRASGYDARVAGEAARRALTVVFEKHPNYARPDRLVARLGHAALLRCDAANARVWLEMHVERFPRARDRERALASLAVLQAVMTVDRQDDRPEGRRSQTPRL